MVFDLKLIAVKSLFKLTGTKVQGFSFEFIVTRALGSISADFFYQLHMVFDLKVITARLFQEKVIPC